MKRTLLAGNWKMQKSAAQAQEFARAFLPRLEKLTADADGDGADGDAAADAKIFARIEIVIAPPFTALAALGDALKTSRAPVVLGAQNVHPESKGAFTGEIAPAMLADAGCRYCIVGHSERRTHFGESDAFVARKVAALFAHGITPILCVGESAEERAAERTNDVVSAQLEHGLAHAPAPRAAELVVAYEPLWAIGAGAAATPAQAQETHAHIRAWLRERYGEAAAAAARIQYGGSVTPENVAQLLEQEDIDGALVGGASLSPEKFAALVEEGARAEART